MFVFCWIISYRKLHFFQLYVPFKFVREPTFLMRKISHNPTYTLANQLAFASSFLHNTLVSRNQENGFML